jgi:hypothetical protein
MKSDSNLFSDYLVDPPFSTSTGIPAVENRPAAIAAGISIHPEFRVEMASR